MLLATDAAGEGIDLQTYCHSLVNFDIPFNPSRLEQRIGRIDRYGQTEEPEVYHFMPDTTASTYAADADFMGRIARKVAQVEYDLGKVNQVIGADIQQHFAGRAPAKRKAKGVDANEVINSALAGAQSQRAWSSDELARDGCGSMAQRQSRAVVPRSATTRRRARAPVGRDGQHGKGPARGTHGSHRWTSGRAAALSVRSSARGTSRNQRARRRRQSRPACAVGHVREVPGVAGGQRQLHVLPVQGV